MPLSPDPWPWAGPPSRSVEAQSVARQWPSSREIRKTRGDRESVT